MTTDLDRHNDGDCTTLCRLCRFYDCGGCGQSVDPEIEPSPCERCWPSYAACCAPCPDCRQDYRDDAAGDRINDERREANA